MQPPLLASMRSMQRIGKTVADLDMGETAYTAPAALFVTPARECCIQTNAPIQRAPDAHASLCLTRTVEGYIADITHCTHQWVPQDRPDDVPHVMVAHVVFADEFLR